MKINWPGPSKNVTPPIFGSYKAVGLETKLTDVLNQADLAILLHEVDARLIIMQRRKLVKQAVSRINSINLYAQQKKWNITSNEERANEVTIDPEQFSNVLNKILDQTEELNQYINNIALPSLQIYYEDMFSNESTRYFWRTHWISRRSAKTINQYNHQTYKRRSSGGHK